jgi:type II secretion system protein H
LPSEVRGLAAVMPKHCAVSGAARQARGFTLIELLVVLIVVGVVVASIQLNLFSDDARRLRNEGERLAALLTALADESVTSGMPLAVSFGDDGYAFWERPAPDAFSVSTLSAAKDDWRARPGDELFSARQMPEGMRIAEVRVRQRVLSRSERQPERLAFSPSGVHQPFSVLLALDDLRVRVMADALGNLRVVDDAEEDAD